MSFKSFVIKRLLITFRGRAIKKRFLQNNSKMKVHYVHKVQRR